MKKLDWYIIKTFFGPFIFIFSVLMFIFIFQFVYLKMDIFVGKGLTFFEFSKLVYFLGLEVVRLVLPLTILLSSIMTFGGFGERYELAAMKSSGLSIIRIMYPLLGFIIILSIWLFYFSNYVLTGNQKRAMNMLNNIKQTRPALVFEQGVFNSDIKPYIIRIGKKEGKNGERWKDVFINKSESSYSDQQTIIAKRGIIGSKDINYMRLKLYDGYIYQNNIQNKTPSELARQPFTKIRFDSLVQMFDISELSKKSFDNDAIGSSYRVKSFFELNPYIDSVKSSNKKYFKNLSNYKIEDIFGVVGNYSNKNTKKIEKIKLISPSYKFEDNSEKIKIVSQALDLVKRDMERISNDESKVKGENKFYARIIVWQHKNIASYSITCILFFLIGAPLGSIIRKGGIGMPVVVAVIIFVIFYILDLSMENKAKAQTMNPYLASWLTNLIFIPLGVFLTIKSTRDSGLFEIENFKRPIIKFINLFIKKKNKEHSRYK